MEEYTETMATVFKLTFPDIDDGTAAALATAVGAFETDVAAAMVPFIEAQKLAGLDGYVSVTRDTGQKTTDKYISDSDVFAGHHQERHARRTR